MPILFDSIPPAVFTIEPHGRGLSFPVDLDTDSSIGAQLQLTPHELELLIFEAELGRFLAGLTAQVDAACGRLR